VFTDIDIPAEYFDRRLQAAGGGERGHHLPLPQPERGVLRDRGVPLRKRHTGLCAGAGGGEFSLTAPVFWQSERKGRDRADKPEYKVKTQRGLLLLQPDSSGGALPQLQLAGARRLPGKGHEIRLCLRHRRLPASEQQVPEEREQGHLEREDCLVLVSNNFSTRTSYENQTKKAITNKFIQEAMTDFLRSKLEIYFIENRRLRRG
jgi:DNA gyrase subunit B